MQQAAAAGRFTYPPTTKEYCTISFTSIGLENASSTIVLICGDNGKSRGGVGIFCYARQGDPHDCRLVLGTERRAEASPPSG